MDGSIDSLTDLLIHSSHDPHPSDRGCQTDRGDCSVPICLLHIHTYTHRSAVALDRSVRELSNSKSSFQIGIEFDFEFDFDSGAKGRLSSGDDQLEDFDRPVK